MFILNGNAERILRTLKTGGLTEYESKAYFTLLLTEKSKMWELSKKSSVPQSKIYSVVEGLRDKGLVYVEDVIPKVVGSKGIEPYLSKSINARQREIYDIIESRNLIQETVQMLKPITVRYKGKYRVFEPKHRRKCL